MNAISAAIATALLVCCLTPVATADQWYDPPIVTAYSNQYREIVVGDLNRDGLTDAVIKGYSQHYVYLMQADGHLVLADSLAGKANISSPSAALIDEDHDGWLDVVTETPHDCRLWRNDRTAHFSDSGKTFLGHRPVVTGDFDLDGYDDLLTAGDSYGVTVYYGSSSGLASSGRWIRLNDSADYLLVVKFAMAADLNGDGIQDLIASGHKMDMDFTEWSRIWWRLGTGDGTYGPVKWFSRNVEYSGYGVFDLTDYDGDLALDIACKCYLGSIDIIRYDKLANACELISDSMAIGQPMFVALDSDDEMDMVTGRWTYGQTLIYRGLGGGDFALMQTLDGPSVCALGTCVTPSGKDIVGAGTGQSGGPTIAVWPWHYPPSATPENADPERALRIAPSVASDRVTIRLPGRLGAAGSVEIVDVRGQVVRRMLLERGNPVWDLRNDHGAPVPSGMYWVRAVSRDGPINVGKVCVVR